MSQKDTDFTFVIPNTRWHREGEGRYWNHIPYPEGILTAVLRKNGYTVSHVDANTNNLTEDELHQILRDKVGKVVGISALSVEYRDSVHKTFGIIKSARPYAKTVLGGVYPSISPEVAKKDEVLTALNVWQGKKPKVEVKPAQDLFLTVPKRKKKIIEVFLEYTDPIEAPIEKGDKLGILKIYESGELTNQIDILSNEKIKRSNIFARLLTTLNYLVWGDV